MNKASRTAFAESCVRLVHEYDFDGLDVDWEYPVTGGLKPGRPEDTGNFTRLLAALRRQFLIQESEDPHRRYLLTSAGPATGDKIKNTRPRDFHPYVDWINLMAYDSYGPWSRRTGLVASLYPPRIKRNKVSSEPSAHTAIETYLAAGVPREKIVLGVPFYGRGWKGVPADDNGLFQDHRGAAEGSRGHGVFEYRDLLRNQVQRMRRYWHDDAKAPWLYDPNARLMISYEDTESVRAKVDYVRRRGLGGLMVWELGQDTDDETSLLRTIWEELK